MSGEFLIGRFLSANPWIWVAAFFTIAMYSFLYKDNVVYKIAENIFVGIAAGYLVVIQYFNIVKPDLVLPLFQEGKFILIIPTILMLLIFARVYQPAAHLSRIPIAFIIGVGAGISIPTTIKAMILEQVRGSLSITYFGGGFWQFFGGVILFFGTICTLIYFFFSKSHEGVFGRVAKVGTYVIMIGFGASFGYTVMARISLLIGRVLFILRDWLGIIG
jgi:hypothetical protein